MNVVIVECDGGNVRSLKNALNYVGIQNVISADPAVIQSADCLIIPGQGHFGAVMHSLEKRGLTQVVRDFGQTKPLLGICVGMQILLDSSEEAPGVAGLGIFPGTVRRFPSSQKIPQMGWNCVQFTDPERAEHFYFANSYYCEVNDPTCIQGTANYGFPFPTMIGKGSICGVQFHPEKSGEKGLLFLENFVRYSC